MASFAVEAGRKIRTGDRFMGQGRRIEEEQKQCVCGLCARTRNIPKLNCTLFTDGGMTVVHQQPFRILHGTLRHRPGVQAMSGRLHGKSGSFEQVYNLASFVDTPQGRWIAVQLISGLETRDGVTQSRLDQFEQALYLCLEPDCFRAPAGDP